ncbi:MAG: signal peptidase I [Clostridiaceae bacterium]
MSDNNKSIKPIKREIMEWAFVLIFSVVITFIIKSNVFAMPMILESSMENTVFEGERIFEYKLNYLFKEPERGDIIILDKYEESKGIIHNTYTDAKETLDTMLGQGKKRYLIKRVVGIPGDLIDIKEGYLYVNGEKIEENYIKEQGETHPGTFSLPIKVPENKVFVLGDNREVSLDSRDLGPIDFKQVKGKVLYRIWPIDKIGSLY